MSYIEISKLISLILRHRPENINIKLDKNGWANVNELIIGIRNKGFDIDFNTLNEVVEQNDKQRFTFNEDKTLIRANQGHSITVELELEELMPPSILYHGTGSKYLKSILKNGINKQKRNYVHLSINEDTALVIGKRHGEPVALKINAKRMYEDGIMFYKSKNDVWLTDHVNAKYIVNFD